jgi:hypothetical protein
MRISGRTFSEHIRLLTPLFGIITAVFALRLLLGFVNVPGWLLVTVSISVIVPICIVLMTVLVHFRRFGGYGNIILSTFMLVVWSQLLIVAGILFSVTTGIENIYTYPEFSIGGEDPYHIRHITGHLTFGVGIETVFGSILSSILLYMLRRTSPRKTNRTQEP